jgi:hypothetical protein
MAKTLALFGAFSQACVDWLACGGGRRRKQDAGEIDAPLGPFDTSPSGSLIPVRQLVVTRTVA